MAALASLGWRSGLAAAQGRERALFGKLLPKLR